jgi:ParB family chromosome partitioning protein
MTTEPKTGLKSIAEGRSDIFRVDPRKLKIKEGWNSRDFSNPDNIEHVDMLAQSIAQIGVKEPLTVYWEDGQAWVSDGESRLRGVMRAIQNYKADIKTIPVKTEDRYANEADRLFSQQIRNAGKPFTPMEQSKLFKRLLDLGWAQKDIAAKSGISASRVSQLLDLLTMPEPIKRMVTQGQVTATMAVAAIKEHNPNKAVEILNDAIVTAKSEGRTRALPKDSSDIKRTPTAIMKDALTYIKDAFESSEIDNSADDVAVIRMPADQFEAIRNALKL